LSLIIKPLFESHHGLNGKQGAMISQAMRKGKHGAGAMRD
jgi:hypothetical protein